MPGRGVHVDGADEGVGALVEDRLVTVAVMSVDVEQGDAPDGPLARPLASEAPHRPPRCREQVRLLIHLERVLFAWQEEYSFSSRPVKETKSAWQPGRLTAAMAGATLLFILVYGGVEVLKVNREAADVSNEPGSHSRHFGTPVDNNSF